MLDEGQAGVRKVERVGASDEDGVDLGRGAKLFGGRKGAEVVGSSVSGGLGRVSAMEADQRGVLAVAEGRHEAEGGVVAESEDVEANGLHDVLHDAVGVGAPRATHVKGK